MPIVGRFWGQAARFESASVAPGFLPFPQKHQSESGRNRDPSHPGILIDFTSKP
jgi:hypothetical protein